MSTRKVIDILPPEKAVSSIKEEFVESTREREIIVKEKRGGGRWLAFSLLLLVSLSAICYFTLSKAEIGLWPQTESLSLEKDLTVSLTVKQIDTLTNSIPAQTFQKEKQLTDTFQASGSILKEEKAKGVLKVYNAYSTSPQVLIATTRFVSSDGKVFRTPVAVTIPGGKYEGGKLVPGETDVEVVADQPGPDYNIDAAIFSIPGFAGTEKYTKFYGRSFSTMSEGLREERAVVTEKDLVEAKDALSVRAKQECQELLALELQAEGVATKFHYFADESLSKIVEEFTLTLAGEEVNEFNFQVKASCETLIFKKEDLWNFAKEVLLSQALTGYKIYEDGLKIDYSFQSVDWELGQMNLALHLNAKAYLDVDLNSLKNALVGKSLLESKLFLEGQPSLTKVSVRFWPFWVNQVPEEIEKIKVDINID
jgi:hypothetical protein